MPAGCVRINPLFFFFLPDDYTSGTYITRKRDIQSARSEDRHERTSTINLNAHTSERRIRSTDINGVWVFSCSLLSFYNSKMKLHFANLNGFFVQLYIFKNVLFLNGRCIDDLILVRKSLLPTQLNYSR